MNYIFDIDGTLSFDGQSIDRQVIQQLTQIRAAGDYVIFASARPIRDTLPIIPDWPDVTIIGGNGSIVRINGQIKVMRAISFPATKKLNQLIDEFQLEYIMDDWWNYAARLSVNNPIKSQLDPNQLAQRVDRKSLSRPIKVILTNLNEHRMQLVQERLLGCNDIKLIKHSGEHNLDITAVGIDKFQTLQTIIPGQPYIAFGNDHNDVELLQHAAQAYWLGSEKLVAKLGLQPTAVIKPQPQALVQLLQAVQQ